MTERISIAQQREMGGIANLRSSGSGRGLRDIAEAAFEAIAPGQYKPAGEVSATGAGQTKRKRKIGVSSVVKPPTEHQEQVALFQWLGELEGAMPELAMVFPIPNGAKLPFGRNKNGKRFSREAMKLKAEGLKNGVPDIFAAIPRGTFHGLFIEMKRAKKSLSRVSPEQLDMKTALDGMGYRVEICYGWEAARDVILDYLGEK